MEGYVEGLAHGVVPADHETWHRLQTETGRLRRLVDDLPKVSRAEERQRDLRSTPSKPDLLGAAAVQAVAPAYAAKGVALETKLDRRLPHVDVAMAGWEAFRLTTVRQPLALMAKEGARILIDRIEGGEATTKPDRRVFPTHLIQRATMGRTP